MEQGVQSSLDVMFPLRMNWKFLQFSNKISIAHIVLDDSDTINMCKFHPGPI